MNSLYVGSGAALVLPRLTLGRAFLEGNFTELRRGVGTYTNRGGTIGWMINPDGVVVVDTQFREQAEDFVSGLKARTERKIDLLINTHHHRDHTSGNIVLVPKSEDEVAETLRLPKFPDHYFEGRRNGVSNALRKAYQELSEG